MLAFEQYAEDVIAGRGHPVGELCRLSVQRHLNDLDRSRRGEIPYRFAPELANHALDFIQKQRHVKGIMASQRQTLKLEPFQQFNWAVIFGWVGRHEETGTIVRRFTKYYNERARKGGKSTEMAAIGNYGLIADGEEGAEIYSAATKLTQAKEVFNIAKSMMNKFKKDYPLYRNDILSLKENITYLTTESKFEPLPSDADTLDGLNPHFALIDEMHAHKDDELLKVLETGMGARANPLLAIITTAGDNIYGPCYRIRKTNIDILRGIKKDERSFSMIYTLDEGDDWHDQSLWYKPNPNMGKAPYLTYLQDMYQKAITEGSSAEIQFKTKNLNIWTTTGITWIRDEKWMAAGTEWEWEMLRRRPCHIGMDLSTYHDLTCLILLFPPWNDDEKFRVLCKFYCPEDNIEKRSRTDGVNYVEWAKDGYIKAMPGESIDEEYLLRDLEEAKGLFEIQLLSYDPALAYKLVQKVENMGIDTESFGQNTRDMNAPIREVEKLIVQKTLDHGCHPILRWNVSNVALYKDTNDKVKFDKKRVTERIDGCVGLAMAMGGYLKSDPPRKSKYESQELGHI